MAGPIAADASGHNHPAVYEPGVCFYLEGSALQPYTNSTINRSAFFCGGRMLTELTSLPQQFTVQMDVWNGMPVDARSVTGWFFSRDHASGLSAHGIHVGIGGTTDGRQGQLILQLGHRKPIVGKTKLERWNWYSIQLKCRARTLQVFLDDGTEPEIEVAFPESMVLPNSIFIGGRSDNENNFEGRIDEVAFFAHDSIVEAASTADKNLKHNSAVSALDAIEAERGGRHWIDQKTESARSAAQSLKSFQVEAGFRIELFASEPLVKDPVAITFDHRGDMYVVEYADYPVGKNGVGGLSRIVCLKDTNNDHQADQRIVFADGLDFAHSLMAYRDGILVGAKTQLLHLIDTDGDGVADQRSVLFDGFAPAHPQMQIGMPVWGLDNRIYCNYGSGEVTSKWAAQTKVRLPRKDFWFDPVSHKFGSTAGWGQYGNTVDRWGNRFFSTNRNPIKSDFLDREIAVRNSHHTVSISEYDVADSGGDSKVFPLRAMKSNYLSHAGTYTAACGTTAWLGPASSPTARQKRLADSVFVCEPIGHVVSRTIVNTDQVPMTSVRAEADRDFLASNDAWFRPSSLQTGPDGALYLADMYRLWVEHPKFLPKEIAQQIDWRAGDDLGRIYRIVVDDQPSPLPVKVPRTPMGFVKSLTSENGWTRLLGQRLFVEKSAVDPSEQVISALRKLCRHTQAETRLHALATLDGVSALRSCELLLGLNDDHPRVRQFAAKLASKTVPTRVVLTSLAAKAKDTDAGVRMQTTVATRPSRQTTVINALAARVLSDGGSPFMADVILTSCHDIESLVLSKAISILKSSVTNQNEDEDGMSSRDAVAGSPVVTEKLNQLAPVLIRLGQAIGRSGNSDQVQGLLNVVINGIESVDSASTVQTWQAALLDGLAIGLKRSPGKQLPTSLPELLERAPKPFTDSVAVLSGWLNQNQLMLHDSKASVNARVAAIRLLSWQSAAVALRQLQPLLGAAQPETIQRAAVGVLLESGAKESVAEVLRHWKHLRPMIRVDVVQIVLRRNSSTSQLLTEMQAGRVSSASLSIDQRARLLTHSNKSIRTVAQEIYPAAVSNNRQEVVQKYASVVTQVGSREQGAEIFKKNCSTCHRMGSVGSVVGPDLTDVRSRSRTALLHEILDPNGKVEPRFCACTVITTDGTTLTGILANETADTIQLRTSGGRLEEVSQSDIEEIITSDRSLMPEGLETAVTEQQMADLLAFLTAAP
ncbi:MAG: PVC-type heme-binding CxxCH protein [Fuerstiella sp.]